LARPALKKHLTRGGRRAGAHWEKLAESFLCSKGLKPLHRNFSCRFGEIDLIMEDRTALVFVEVKYRKNNRHGSGSDAVTRHKQGKISRTAAWFLADNPHRAEQTCRFDVISIGGDKVGQDVNWIRNAFEANTGQ